jgi:beta-N-acetylhexosaminidase
VKRLSSIALLFLVTLVFAEQPSLAAPTSIQLDAQGERWARETLARLSTEEKVGQMIMVWAKVRFLNAHSSEYQKLREAMSLYHVGGFGVTVPVEGGQLVMSEPLEAAQLTNSLQRDSKYPLLFAADFERGLSMRLIGATPFPAAMAFGAVGDPALARAFGRITALEARAIGVHWNWFPDTDVNSNPTNPIIGTRSFSEDPAVVGSMAAAYIAGAHEAGMLTTAKHFPGHGDTDTDSHLALARVHAPLDRLNSLELAPFRAAIAAGVDSVMTGHLLVPALETDANKPASISAKITTDLLETQLGFHGLVVTDAIDMNGLKQFFHGSETEIAGQEAVAAVEAGNDMVIIPGSLEGAYTGLLKAVESGRISTERMDRSVLKILRMKAEVGLDKNRFVDLNAVNDTVGRPENIALAHEVAERAITLVADKPKLLPLAPTARTVAIVFSDRTRQSEAGRIFSLELRMRAHEATVYFVDATNAAYLRNEILTAAASSERVIAISESMPAPRAAQEKSSSAIDSQSLKLLADLVAAAPEKTVVATLGDPYTGGALPGLATYLCSYSDTPLSAASLVRALYGETPIHGRLPVTIPELAVRGVGLDRDTAAQITAISTQQETGK